MYYSACQMIIAGLPELDGFDPRLGLKLHADAMDDYHAALCRFSALLPEFKDNLVNGRFPDSESLAQAVHELRCSANSVGAHIIARLAEGLESVIRQKRTQLFTTSVVALLNYCDRFTDVIGDHLRAFSTSENRQMATVPQLLGYLRKLQSCAEDFALTGAEEIVAAMDFVVFPSLRVEALIDQIREAVDQINYDLIGELSGVGCAMCDADQAGEE